MGRGDPLVRQFRLLQYLDERREVAVYEAAEELGCSPRTLYRDLLVLERIGVPLYQDRRGKRVRWKVVEQFRQKLRLSLTWPEMLALATGQELLKGLSGTLFHESALSALQKLQGALPKELSARAAAATGRVSADMGATHDYRDSGAVVQQLVVAVERQETVRLRYRKPGDHRHTARLVDPYHLHVQAGALYLLGWCHSRDAVRTFLVDRAAEAVLTGQRFEPHSSFAAGDLMQGSFGPWSGKAVSIKLRFIAEGAAFVAERRIHPSQTTRWRGDGSLDLQLKAPLSPALLAWVVGWGPRVRVVGPKSLVGAVRAEHEAALGQKKKPTYDHG